MVLSDRLGRVRLVALDSVGPGSGATGRAGDAKVLQERDEHGRVSGLARRDGDNQGQAVTVDQVMEFGRRATSGAAEAMISRLDQWIVVVPPVTRVMFVAC